MNRQGVLRVASFVGCAAPYTPLLHLQEALAEAVRAGAVGDTLLLLEHPPTYTIGKRGRADVDFRPSAAAAAAAAPSERGAEVVRVPRGGQTTWHGPGQLVAYPIVNLRARGLGARRYVEALEDSVVEVAGAWGLAARGRVPGATGVWVGERKLAAVGVRIAHGVASHGLALNVCPDLSWFDAIVPCGQPGKAVTSIAAELGAGSRVGGAATVARAQGQLLVALVRRLHYRQFQMVDHQEAMLAVTPQPT